MTSLKLSEIDELKIIYQEIIEGCSPVSGKFYFIKHLNELEQTDLVRKRIEFFDDYIQQGVPSEDTRLKELAENGEWGAEEEDKITSLKLIIKDNEKLLPTVITQQQEPIKQIINSYKEELFQLLTTRHHLIGLNANSISERDSINYMLFYSCYLDRKCQQRKFKNWDEFESLQEEEITTYLDDLDSVFLRMKPSAIRKIAVLPFFLNSFAYCKDAIHTFLGRPIVEMTSFQADLFSYGGRNLSILNQASGEPPEILGDTKLDDVINWYDRQYSVLLGKRSKEQNK